VLLTPLRLEFGWGEVAQRGMDPLVHVHVIQETTNLAVGIMIVSSPVKSYQLHSNKSLEKSYHPR